MSNLIIGSKGFVGSALLRFAEQHLEDEWIGIDRHNYSMWRHHPFNKVVWCAGSSRKKECNDDPDKCYDLNIVSLLNTFTDFPTMKFIYLSSQAVYPEDCKNQHENLKIQAEKLDNYGKMKFMGEELVQARCPKHLIIRPNSFVGPGLKHNVIHKMVHRPEEPVRDGVSQYMHTDFFALCVFVLDKLVDSGTYNVTSPDSIHVTDIAKIINVKLNKIKQPTGEGVPERKAMLNTQKFERLFKKWNIPIPTSRDAVGKWNDPIKTCLPDMWSRMGFRNSQR